MAKRKRVRNLLRRERGQAGGKERATKKEVTASWPDDKEWTHNLKKQIRKVPTGKKSTIKVENSNEGSGKIRKFKTKSKLIKVKEEMIAGEWRSRAADSER